MNYPKIGIRPVIDGRWGGVRESLEEQTMGMATSAANSLKKIFAILTAHLFSALFQTQLSAAVQKLLLARNNSQQKMLLQLFP